jgi:hypothetical protein
LVLLTISLTACSNSSTSTPLGSVNNELPAAAELAVGTLKLSGTSQSVTAEQAEELVVYWETYKQLSQSDTAAQAEFDGLTAQIQETLTADQIQAISDMNITQQDVFASMQGVNSTVSNTTNGSTISVPSGYSGGAGMPAGGPPADGGTPPDGGMPSDLGGAAPSSSADQAQSAQASSGSGAIAGVPSALIEAVIQSLQQIVAA